jgi:hypothetical protein
MIQTIITALLSSITVTGVFAGLLAFVPKIGDKLLEFHFDRKLAEFKGELDEKLERLKGDQKKEIEGLKEKYSHLTDRGRRSNEKEYAATTLVWESYVDAHFATMRAVVAFSEHPNLKEMSEQDLDEFLRSGKLSERQIDNVKQAQDKNARYASTLHLIAINEALHEIYEMRDILIKQSVFIERSLRDLFEKRLDSLTVSTVIEKNNFGQRVLSALVLMTVRFNTAGHG